MEGKYVDEVVAPGASRSVVSWFGLGCPSCNHCLGLVISLGF